MRTAMELETYSLVFHAINLFCLFFPDPYRIRSKLTCLNNHENVCIMFLYQTTEEGVANAVSIIQVPSDPDVCNPYCLQLGKRPMFIQKSRTEQATPLQLTLVS